MVTRGFGTWTLAAWIAIVSAVSITQAAQDKLGILPTAGFPPRPDRGALEALAERYFGYDSVIVLNATQILWQKQTQHTHVFRRLLALEGASARGAITLDFPIPYGGSVVRFEVEAVSPEGVVQDASAQSSQESTPRGRFARAIFAEPAPGELLDVHIEIARVGWEVRPWWIQEENPVEESRFLVVAPPGMTLRVHGGLLSREAMAYEQTTLPNGTLYAWSFPQVQPLRQEPLLPPWNDIIQHLAVLPESVLVAGPVELSSTQSSASLDADPSASHPSSRNRSGPAANTRRRVSLPTDWETYSVVLRDTFDGWIRKDEKELRKKARELTGDVTDSDGKLEQIRQFVNGLTVEGRSHRPLAAAPTHVLESGAGSSAEIAAITLALLREIGIEADLIAFRPRGDGRVLLPYPVATFLTEFLLRFKHDGAEVMWYPLDDRPIGELPLAARGALAAPLVEGESVITLPDLEAEENRSTIDVAATIEADRTLRADSVHTHVGPAAEGWRRKFFSDALHSSVFETWLRSHLPTANVIDVTVEDDAWDRLVIRAIWEVADFVEREDGEMTIDPVLFSAVAATLWPDTKRRYPIDLGAPYVMTQRTTFRWSDGTRTEGVFRGHQSRSPNGGRSYRLVFEPKADELVVNQSIRIQQTRYRPSSYRDLRDWFIKVEQSEAQSIGIVFGVGTPSISRLSPVTARTGGRTQR